MIRVTLQVDGEMVDSLRTADAVQAEAAYFAWAARRTDAVGSVRVQGGGLVPDGLFRTDADWPPGTPRETYPERQGLWAERANETELRWPPPSVEQARGLIQASGLSFAEAWRQVGVGARQGRRLVAEGASVNFAQWFTLRAVCLAAMGDE